MIKYVKIYSKKEPSFTEEDIFKIIIPTNKEVSSDQVTDQVTDQVKILDFCKIPRTRAEIMSLLNLKHRPTFRDNYLKPLLEKKLLELTDPDSKTSPKQRYLTIVLRSSSSKTYEWKNKSSFGG